MRNSPVNLNDPTGHSYAAHNPCYGAENGYRCNRDRHKAKQESQENGWDIIGKMKPGDMITLGYGDVQTSLILGLLVAPTGQEPTELGFWNLDEHEYVPVYIVAQLLDVVERWTLFKRTDTKTFNSYEVAGSKGTPYDLPNYRENWTGGVDDKSSYVEISTRFTTGHIFGIETWEGVPMFFMFVSALAVPYSGARSVKLLDYGLTVASGLPTFLSSSSGENYFLDGEYIEEIYPIIHP